MQERARSISIDDLRQQIEKIGGLGYASWTCCHLGCNPSTGIYPAAVFSWVLFMKSLAVEMARWMERLPLFSLVASLPGPRGRCCGA